MVPTNIAHIRRRIDAACARAGRAPSAVTLVAVTKTFPPAAVHAAVAAGVTDIGENYVQELLGKRAAVGAAEIRWHFIGHLQSNKAKFLVPWIHLIHAVDARSTAEAVNRLAAKAGRRVDVLVEVNTTGESSKYGVSPGETPAFVRSLAPYEAIRIAGLMTIGPFLPDPEGSRPMFRALRTLAEELADGGQGNVAMHHLSMGMTGDFEVAIEEGATIVRIGTAIFGARSSHADHPEGP
jgi:pyridoxal phosphate enzyme (YggS family)